MPKEDGEGKSKALHMEVAICQQALRVIDHTCGLLVELGAAQMYWMRHLVRYMPCIRGKPSHAFTCQCIAAAPVRQLQLRAGRPGISKF